MKKFRIIFSAAVIILFSAAFLNFGKDMKIFPEIIKSSQLLPALINLIYNLSLIALISVSIIIILTLITGRVYCSFLCPLGILQDMINFSAGKISRRRKNKYYRKINLRYYFAAVIFIITAAGSMIMINLSDPYTIFGRIFSDFFRSAIVFILNFIISAGEYLKIYIFSKQNIYETVPASLLLSALYFTVIFISAALKGRAYCNFFCPTGTILSLLTRFSLFRFFIDEKCISCGKCEAVCKSGCIDFANRKIDHEDCVMCFNCLKICPEGALNFTSVFSVKRPSVEKSGSFSRKKILILTVSGAVSASAALLLRSFKFLDYLFPEKITSETRPVPPGSISVEHLRNRCVSCHLCISACPTNIIVPSSIVHNGKGIFQPVLNYENGYCTYECVRCTQVCPTGAIEHLTPSEKNQISIGEIRLEIDKCIVTTRKTDCGACAEHCPTGAVYMEKIDNLNYPVTDTSKCVGCGACTHVCPSIPLAITIAAKGVHSSLNKVIPEGVEKRENKNEFSF